MSSDSEGDGFAPSDYSDGRSRWEWESRYPDEAREKIRFEACYCLVLLFFAPAILVITLSTPFKIILPMTVDARNTFQVLITAWLGGTLGGTVYAMKWLYHTVGKGWWHMDRRLWRLLTPHVSAGVSFSFIALASSELFEILSYTGLESFYTLLGISFLLGYFSDTAIAKLAEIAGVLFGTVRDHEPSEPSVVDEEREEGT